ncbi:MAG: hypothetical protein H0U18_07255 [Pyrinomonadaceae bacterium]|nr:hypothetical protein [Pyrinomonadaceae bacterium]
MDLVQDAAVTPDLAKSNTGPALDWHRMSYLQRRDAMRVEMCETLKAIPGNKPGNLTPSEDEWMTFWVTIGGKKLLAPLHAVPAGLSQSAAREKVGQPFLLDHKLHTALAGGDGGPMHIVACYKGATESQALKMLGSGCYCGAGEVWSARCGLGSENTVRSTEKLPKSDCGSERAHGLARMAAAVR